MDLILYAGIYVNTVQDVSAPYKNLRCSTELPFMSLNLFSMLHAKLFKSSIFSRAMTHLQMHLSIPLMKQKAARESMQNQQENKIIKEKKKKEINY